MPELDPIKGKVIIEYDGSGVAEAKKDLSSLADIVGGSLADSTGGANDALSSLDEQMGKSADSTAALTSSVTALAKPMQNSGAVITTVSEAMAEHQAAVEDASSAYEGLKQPIEDTVAMLPQFASSLHEVSKEFDPRKFGLDTFNENFAVFQDALQNPYPFQMIHQYLGETGQTWDDFSSSIGDSNSAFLDQMAAMPVTSSKAFDAMSSGVQGVGQSFVSAAGDTEAFNKQWNDVAASIGEVGQAGGVGTVLLGPAESWSKLDSSLASAQEGINKFGGVGMGGYGPQEPIDFSGLGTGFGNIVQGFDTIMRPLMYAQMAGMMIGALGSGIYNMAALAEGPAAHSIGSFTGSIDVLGQHMQQTSEQFSEGLGQGIMPFIDAMNNVAGNGKTTDFWGAVGGGISEVGSLLGGLGGIAGGGIEYLAHLAFAPSWQGITTGNSMLQTGSETLQNLWAQITGQPEPYPTPGVPGSSTQSTIQQTLMQNITAMNAQANDPQYLAAQAYLSSQTAYAQLGQTSYDAGHMSGKSAFDYTPQAYQQAMINAALQNGESVPGLSGVDLNRAFFTNMLNQLPPEFTGGCFVAGTPVLLADGTERAIETLQIGEQVLSHDGEQQGIATVRDRLVFPAKQTYKLLFSGGNALTTTDSHPIMTAQGWKSISPASTKKENPDLAVLPLQIGDSIHTVNGACTLLSIETREIVQVFNITTDGPHTYYANNILVHNAKAMASQVMQNVANTEVPQMDMKNSNLIQSMMGNFSDTDLTHTFTATVNWVASGDLSHTFQGAASWIGQNLLNTFEGAASWIGNNLLNTFTGDASWLGNNLKNTFLGDASWIGQGLSNIFTGVASWVSSGGLEHTFQGVADWIGQNLEHTFTGIASWVATGLSQTANVPGFASGVTNFGGGLAVVGEYGPELVHLPQGTNVYPQSAMGDFPSLGMGNDGTGGPLTIIINHTSTLNGKVVAQETIPYIAPVLRSQMAVRR